MKRFHCSGCLRTKRVRRLPAVKPNQQAHAPKDRLVGLCRRCAAK